MRIKETIKTLAFLSGKINMSFSSCIEVNYYKEKFNTHIGIFDKEITLDKVVTAVLLEHFLINVCSYLDEWNKELSPEKHPESRDRILRLKTITKPAVKRINKWSGLKDYRNVILAHNMRIKGGESVLSNEKTFEIPNSSTESLLLNTLIYIITLELIKEFKDLNIDWNFKLADFIKLTNIEIDEKEELRVIVEKMNEIKLQVTPRL